MIYAPQQPDPSELITAYLEGALSADQVAELEAFLREDRGRAKAYVYQAMLDCQLAELMQEENLRRVTADLSDDTQFGALLQELGEQESRAVPLPIEIETESTPTQDQARGDDMLSAGELLSLTGYLAKQAIQTKAGIGLAGSLAAMLIIGVVLAVAFGGSDDPVITAEQAGSSNQRVVATLTAEQGASWDRRPGQDLYAGQRFTLTRGFAEITTHNGAVAILEAPATVEFVDNANALRLHAGKLVGICETPGSKGFTVHTEHAEVVDIGTRFGVAVDRASQTTLEVFSGEVIIAPVVEGRAMQPERVLTGQSARAGAGKIVFTPSPAEPALSRFAGGLSFERDHAWPAFHESLINDPSVIAYYGLNQPAGNVLSASRGEASFDAQIINARWGDGRTPGSRALTFTGRAWDERIVLSQAASDKLAMQGAFTISAWFNIHDLSRINSWTSLITKGNDSWRILATNKANRRQLGFYVSTNKENPGLSYIGAVTDSFELRRWNHLTITGEPRGDGIAVKLYIDGQVKAERLMPGIFKSDHPVAFGANASRTKGALDMGLDGQLGEIAFFNRALPEDEVRQLYHASSDSASTP